MHVLNIASAKARAKTVFGPLNRSHTKGVVGFFGFADLANFWFSFSVLVSCLVRGFSLI